MTVDFKTSLLCSLCATSSQRQAMILQQILRNLTSSWNAVEILVGHRRVPSVFFHWMKPSPACTCSAPEQTSHHILYECPVLGPPGDGNVDLPNLTPETITGYNSYMKLPRSHSIADHTKEEVTSCNWKGAKTTTSHDQSGSTGPGLGGIPGQDLKVSVDTARQEW